MRIITLTNEMKIQAEEFVERYMPHEKIKNYENRWDMSIKPNYVGILGEIAVHSLIGVDAKECLKRRATYCSDKGFDIEIKGKKYDIKTLKSKVMPNTSFRYNVQEHVINKKPDGYIFNCLLADESVIIPVGFISKEDFMEKATFHKKGEKVDFNGFVFRYNTYDISINDLEDIKSLLD